MQGTVAAAFRYPVKGEAPEHLDEALVEVGSGIAGDAHARPGTDREILLATVQHLRDLDLKPGDVRENLTIDGLDVDALPLPTRLRCGTALLEVRKVCDPCYKMEAIRPGLQSQLEGRRGMLCRVVEAGVVRPGDLVSIED